VLTVFVVLQVPADLVFKQLVHSLNCGVKAPCLEANALQRLEITAMFNVVGDGAYVP